MKNKLLFSILLIGMGIANAQNAIDNYLTGTPTYKTIGTSSNRLSKPRDLDFKPGTYELWVLNEETGSSASITIFEFAGQSNQKSKYKKDSNASHFMNMASGIAMGAMSVVPGYTSNILFGISCEGTNGGDNFMGPTLWPTDTNIFCKIHQNDNYLGSHCDMLHQSPKSGGIAHQEANIYWVTDGSKGNICKYDFAIPHAYGDDDHSDGKIYRYAEVKFGYKAGVPSHLVMDKATGWLYICDTGNKRILRMNTKTGTASGNLTETTEPLALYKSMTGVTWEVYISTGLIEPCGIDFYNGRLIVTDHSNGDIIIYNTTGGSPVEMGRVKTASTGIMGVIVGPDTKIWYVDNAANKVVRVDPNPTTSVQELATDNTFNVYPNPSTDHVIIEGENGVLADSKVTLHNMLGEELFNTNSKSNYLNIDLSPYPNGVYFLSIKRAEGITTKKIVINK